MKRCYDCGLDQPVDQFPINTTRLDGRGSMCKTCKKKYNATYYLATKEKHNPARAERRRRVKAEVQDRVYEYLRCHPCADCGETDIVVLDFDHQERKSFGIADMITSGMRWELIQAEIKKCEVVCANDHRRRTARSFGWRRAIAA